MSITRNHYMSGMKLHFKTKYYMPGFFYTRTDCANIITDVSTPLCSSTLVFVVLLSGNIELSVNKNQTARIEGPGKLVSISPNSVLNYIRGSEDMQAIILGYGLDFLVANMNMLKYIPDISFSNKFQYNYTEYQIPSDRVGEILASAMRLESVVADKAHFYWEEMIRINALEMHLHLSDVTLRMDKTVSFREVSRARDLYRQFFLAVVNNVHTHREVSYYADKLCISSKYLNTITHKVTGKSSSAIINDIAIMASAALLRDMSMSIKQISSIMGFKNQSAFTKFFTKGMGCNPTEFRYE